MVRLVHALLAVLAYTAVQYEVLATINPQSQFEVGPFTDNRNIIRIGASTSLLASDVHSAGGNMLADGWKMFVNWVNLVRGGLKLFNETYLFQVGYVEDYSDALYVSYVYDKLVTRGEMDFYFAPYSSLLTEHAADVTAPAKQLLIAAFASNSSIYKKNDYSLGLMPPANSYHEAPFKVYSGLGASSIALLNDIDNPLCLNETNSHYFASVYNIELFGHFQLDPKSANYSADIRGYLEQMKAADVETVYVCSYLSLCTEVCTSCCIRL
jgi:hypothetical protein